MEDKEEKVRQISRAWSNILNYLGIKNWDNDKNFINTPNRIARSLINEKCKGMNSEDECKNILDNTFDNEYDGMVIIGPIITNGICPHHFENINYSVKFGYIPEGKLIGLSKPSRVIDLVAKQPILQEDYTKKLADIFMECIKPYGVGIIVEGKHACMSARGTTQLTASTITSEVRGSFREDSSIKNEFLKLCGY